MYLMVFGLDWHFSAASASGTSSAQKPQWKPILGFCVEGQDDAEIDSKTTRFLILFFILFTPIRT
jgi:hypothetical protein